MKDKSQIVLFIVVFLLHSLLSAQERYENETRVTRILFILDASGSMKTEWDNSNRFKVATRLLAKVVDSIEKVNRSVEFGLRVYGHQSPRQLKDCEDSKLEVPFSKYNSANVTSKLAELKPRYRALYS